MSVSRLTWILGPPFIYLWLDIDFFSYTQHSEREKQLESHRSQYDYTQTVILTGLKRRRQCGEFGWRVCFRYKNEVEN